MQKVDYISKKSEDNFNDCNKRSLPIFIYFVCDKIIK